MSNADRGLLSSRGTGQGPRRSNRRRTRSVRDEETPPEGEQNISIGPQQPSSPVAEQTPLTQADIPKIVELIVRQLPVASNNSQASAANTQQTPSSLTCNQVPPIAFLNTSSAPGGSTSIAGNHAATTLTALPLMEGSSRGDGAGSDAAGTSVQLPLTVPGKLVFVFK